MCVCVCVCVCVCADYQVLYDVFCVSDDKGVVWCDVNATQKVVLELNTLGISHA